MKLRSGTTKRKKTSILDIEENAEIKKVISLNRRFAPKGANTENLDKKLFLRNLRIVFVLVSLSKDREWAHNHAIQAAADPFGVCIEIIDSNSASFALVIFLPQEIPQNLVIKKHIILGHIDQVHFVSR